MSIVTCPTTIVEASAVAVWRCLTSPAALARWSGTVVREQPSHGGELRVGDRLVLAAGPTNYFRIVIDVVDIDRPVSIALDARLPFGVINHERVVISPTSPISCRVTFN